MINGLSDDVTSSWIQISFFKLTDITFKDKIANFKTHIFAISASTIAYSQSDFILEPIFIFLIQFLKIYDSFGKYAQHLGALFVLCYIKTTDVLKNRKFSFEDGVIKTMKRSIFVAKICTCKFQLGKPTDVIAKETNDKESNVMMVQQDPKISVREYQTII